MEVKNKIMLASVIALMDKSLRELGFHSIPSCYCGHDHAHEELLEEPKKETKFSEEELTYLETLGGKEKRQYLRELKEKYGTA